MPDSAPTRGPWYNRKGPDNGKDFIDETIEAWQPYYPEPLSREDALEIAHNAIGFVSLLRVWALEERRMILLGQPTTANEEEREVVKSPKRRRNHISQKNCDLLHNC